MAGKVILQFVLILLLACPPGLLAIVLSAGLIIVEPMCEQDARLLVALRLMAWVAINTVRSFELCFLAWPQSFSS
jgi:hypothetical protein